jgi:anti-sigma factor RsiW
MQHTEEHQDLLVGLLTGELEPDEVNTVEMLLDCCPECPELLAEYESALLLLNIPHAPRSAFLEALEQVKGRFPKLPKLRELTPEQIKAARARGIYNPPGEKSSTKRPGTDRKK